MQIDYRIGVFNFTGAVLLFRMPNAVIRSSKVADTVYKNNLDKYLILFEQTETIFVFPSQRAFYKAHMTLLVRRDFSIVEQSGKFIGRILGDQRCIVGMFLESRDYVVIRRITRQ